MKNLALTSLGILTLLFSAAAQPLLVQQPTLSEDHVVFVYAGDLWSVARDGGDAVRLTTAPGLETEPHFSPDGSRIAFTGEYDGNVDVYVVDAAGGVPERLTFHPDRDHVAGWTRDGKSVLFRSARHSYSSKFYRLFTISTDGGFPTELPLPMAATGSYSEDSTQLAYMPLGFGRPPNRFDAWKRYRGGRTDAIWIADLSDSSVVEVPRTDSNDSLPQWVGDKVYFLSDREGAVTLFSYDTKSRKVDRLIDNQGLDLKWISAGPGAIVYEQFGGIYVYNIKSKKSKQVQISIHGDLPEVRPRYEKVDKAVRSMAISPTGARVVMEARGEILTVPAKKGDPRNLTNTTGVHERGPAWSPDGKQIAYFSDESGEYALHIRDQNGSEEPKKITLAETPGFYFDLIWSPDSEKLAYTDNRLNLWYVDTETGAPVKVDTDTYYEPLGMQENAPAWAPDSRWITYCKMLENHLRAVHIYSLESGEVRQVTDGMSDARYVAFDKSGKYLYFAASTSSGLGPGWLDMSSGGKAIDFNVYVAVLRNDVPSPLAPESDEEAKDEEADKKDEEKKDDEPERVEIDFDGIDQRILALPIPAKNYTSLRSGKEGELFLHEDSAVPDRVSAERILHRFTLKERKVEKFLGDVGGFAISHDGEKIVYGQKGSFFIAETKGEPKAGEGKLNIEAAEVHVDPRVEWRQMYDEVWRIQREYFYDPNHHGLDLDATAQKYEPYLQGVASRVDLNYLFQEMLGHITVGHLYIGGGKIPDVKRVPVGLLGADFTIENGRYRLARVFDGENWNPQLKAPLTQPGVNVTPGEYLLAVNGRDVTPPANLFSFFEATAGKQVVLRVGANPNGDDARDVTVVPIPSDRSLRHRAWVEDNRRKVDEMSDGKVAYVHLPDTAKGGMTSFDRYYFAQVGKQAAVIDERFNSGGQAADYIVDYLNRPLLNHWSTRYGADFTTPARAIFGPKAMIVNEMAGSGGDAMPWYFRELKIGPLVGKRTWGGLVGILGFPPLMDGGSVTSPNVAFWNTRGEWDVENYGVAPDVEVEFDPKLVREGNDPQLEKAVELVLEELRRNPLPEHKKPAYPNYNNK
jgi:tricorn protease